MMYEFRAVDGSGDTIERSYPMSKAPPLGKRIKHGGRIFERVVSTSVQTDMKPSHWNYPVVSRALPRKLKGCRHTDKGHTIIENRKHEQDLCAKHGLRRADDFGD